MTAGHRNAGGRRDRRKRRTRLALLDAAMELFTERGIHGTRIADITERADVGKGVFYNYFETKESLIALLVREGLDELELELASGVAEDASLQERVAGLARLHETFFVNRPEYALLIHQARGLLQLRGAGCEPLREVFRSHLARLSRWLPPPRRRAAWSQEVLMDTAAALAGAVAGYRSFMLAAGLPVRETSVGRALSHGIPWMMEQRCRSPGAEVAGSQVPRAPSATRRRRARPAV